MNRRTWVQMTVKMIKMPISSTEMGIFKNFVTLSNLD